MKYLLLTITTCFTIPLCAQSSIFFTDKAAQKDHLKLYLLTNTSDLFFIAYFDKPLTTHLRQLSPDLPADSLVKAGNYQFTIYIDNKQIYSSNLMPGAPHRLVQDTATTLHRPLINNKNGNGSWSESFWNRFLTNGGDSALTDGKHMLRMEIRPYLKSQVGELMAAGELPIQVARHPKIDISTIVLHKPTPYDGFPVSKEPFDRDKIKELKAAINAGIFKRVSSIIVLKNGKLLIEEYFNGEARHTLHDTRSVGKSFASTVMGIAIKDGYIKNEQQRLRDFYNFDTAKGNTSIKELLTMSSGFDGNDEDNNSPGNEENMYPSSNWVKFTLDLPFNPTGTWRYFTAGVILLGDILNKQVPGGLEKYAHEKLFKPLNISNYKWQYTPQHVPNTAGGIQMNALDFARYGQLYKNGGLWNGKQVIPKEWIDKTFTKQKQIPGRNHEYYGYLFWNKSFLVNNKPHEAYYCAGNGGNYILVFKDLPLVVVITATAYSQPYAHSQVTRMLSEYILPAVVE